MTYNYKLREIKAYNNNIDTLLNQHQIYDNSRNASLLLLDRLDIQSDLHSLLYTVLNSGNWAIDE